MTLQASCQHEVDFKHGLKIHPVGFGNPGKDLSFFYEMGFEFKFPKGLKGLEVLQEELLLPEGDFDFIVGLIGRCDPPSNFWIEVLNFLKGGFAGHGDQGEVC